jgi:pimeloyl-ACP methyl ester carboxylesterase
VPDIGVMALPDGRELAWIEHGVRDGAPVFGFHGSPGTAHHFAGLSEVAARKDVRLIAPDRSGYGHSTYHPARSYESWARDVGVLADHLGIDRFAVLGYSSGGPNAAACARFLGDRLVGCAIVSGPAPPEVAVAKQGMLLTNRIAHRLAPLVPRLFGVAYQAGLRHAQRAPDRRWRG